MSSSPVLHVHSWLPRSRANGPGWRAVLWLQGCSLGCPGCFNPETHSFGSSRRMTAKEILAEVGRAGEIEGLTISGGEPLQQPEGLLALVRAVRRDTTLSVLLFSGYAIEEIRGLPLGPSILASTDVLVDGRYESTRHLGRGLRGSANQRLHLLTDRYRLSDLEATPTTEVVVDPDGSIAVTGIAPLALRSRERGP